MTTLHDPFGRCTLPRDLSVRETRVEALGELAAALLDGRLPERDVCIFIGSALSVWLAGGGSLERDYFKTLGPQGSHRTHSAIWQASQDSADIAIAESQYPHLDESDPQTDNA